MYKRLSDEIHKNIDQMKYYGEPGPGLATLQHWLLHVERLEHYIIQLEDSLRDKLDPESYPTSYEFE